MTTCLIIIGILALMQAADDWGLWVRLEHLYRGENRNAERKQLKTEIVVLNPDYVRENR